MQGNLPKGTQMGLHKSYQKSRVQNSIAVPCRRVGGSARKGAAHGMRQAADTCGKIPVPECRERGMLTGCVGIRQVQCGKSDTPSREAMEWSEAAVRGRTPPARSVHTAVYLPEQQKMLVFGGYSPPLSPRLHGRARVLSCGKPATPCGLSPGEDSERPGLGGRGLWGARVAML